MGSLLHFLRYNNAVPVSLSIVLLGAGAAFASSPDARSTLYESSQRVVASDNTYLVQMNLDVYTPEAYIQSVTEDDEHYYVRYTLKTINIIDNVWKDVTEERTMKVAKSVLGDSIDLGLYVTKQLREVVDSQRQYLKEAQALEEKQVSQKVVATEYSGLIGQFITPETEVLPGYTPIVIAPEPPVVLAQEQGSVTGQQLVASAASAISLDETKATLTLMGNSLARIPLRTTYSDLGAVLTQLTLRPIQLRTSLNGKEVEVVQIDTTVPGEYVVVYEALDEEVVVARLQRTVEVYDPSIPEVLATTTAAVAAATTTATTTSP